MKSSASELGLSVERTNVKYFAGLVAGRPQAREKALGTRLWDGWVYSQRKTHRCKIQLCFYLHFLIRLVDKTFSVARIIEPPWKRNYKFVEHRVLPELKALLWFCWQPGFEKPGNCAVSGTCSVEAAAGL